MNIFYLDSAWHLAARHLCDRHVVKMTLETTQILCSIHHYVGNTQVPYRKSHINHPCCVWSRQSFTNWLLLMNYGRFLASEYTFRYNKTHACAKIMDWLLANTKPSMFPTIIDSVFVQPPPLVPNVKHLNPYHSLSFSTCPVTAHREYYIEKSQFIDMQWNKGRPRPHWMPQ